MRVLLCFLALTSQAWAGNTPDPSGSSVTPEITARGFIPFGKTHLMAELGAGVGAATSGRGSVTLGAYHHLLPQLRAGIFFSRRYGLRHDEDWVKGGGDAAGSWGWTDSRGRGENHLTADLSPRARVPFLPGDSWVAELKSRLIHNFAVRRTTAMFRPGLSYFHLREGAPAWSAFARYEIQFPLNSFAHATHDQWVYLGGLIHLGPRVQAGAYAAYEILSWESTAAFTATTGATFASTLRSVILGGLLIFRAPE